MRIINLIENTEGETGCAAVHGLSFYIETAKHKLLVDLGPSAETMTNAEKLGIDLKQVDAVILSHGHYDHSGGILPFATLNPGAAIYMQKTATAAYYADDSEAGAAPQYRYIGIDEGIAALPQVRLIDGDCIIDDELSLFVIKERAGRLPFSNARLKRETGGVYQQDEFDHEHFLIIKEGSKRVLVSGCAHNGILNILKEYTRRFGAAPDAVISGFHLMKKTNHTAGEIREIENTAKELTRYDTVFYTCHCTGLPAFEIMKRIMGSQLEYVHSGDEIALNF
ncbi:MAG: MBL fold metallo-hydrolase [Clostridiales bacterium]|nr:MBL fold metallo-hydrolase [Clostridiales bacterium]